MKSDIQYHRMASMLRDGRREEGRRVVEGRGPSGAGLFEFLRGHCLKNTPFRPSYETLSPDQITEGPFQKVDHIRNDDAYIDECLVM